MNNLSHMIRKFTRFELKYIFNLKQTERFKSALRGYLAPDNHGNNSGAYALASLYYDFPGLRCYHEKVDGVKFRRKLRIRLYEIGEVLTDESPVFLEIKQRIDLVTQKRRIIMPHGAALRLCNDRQIQDYTPEDESTIEEIYAFFWQYNLHTVIIKGPTANNNGALDYTGYFQINGGYLVAVGSAGKVTGSGGFGGGFPGGRGVVAVLTLSKWLEEQHCNKRNCLWQTMQQSRRQDAAALLAHKAKDQTTEKGPKTPCNGHLRGKPQDPT